MDRITSETPISQIIQLLAQAGCPDMTQQLDLPQCSEWKLPEGGQGDIYKGVLFDGKRVAIKTARGDSSMNLSTGDLVFKRVARELYTWFSLSHSNIAQFLGMANFRGHIAMVSPWVDPGNFYKFIDKYPETDRMGLCIQIANGLAYLHENGVVFGDLKAQNILIGVDGIPKMTDFGLSVLENSKIVFSTTTNFGGGTVRWMAPELIAGSTGRSYAADLYALGMTFIEVFTDEVPFPMIREDTQVMFAVAFKHAIPDQPERLKDRSSQHEMWWSTLKQCWDRNPSLRPSARLWSTLNDESEFDALGVEEKSTPVPLRVSSVSTSKPNKSTLPAARKPKRRKESESKMEHVVLLKGHESEVCVVAWNPTIPNILATGGKDGTVRLWSISDDSKEPTLPPRICTHPSTNSCHDITTVTWNSDGSLLATGAYDGVVRVWTDRGALCTVLAEHKGPIFSIKWSKEGLLLTGSLDDTVIVWDLENGWKAKQRCAHHHDGRLDAEWLEKNFFAACGSDRNIFIEHIGDTSAVARLAGHQDEVNRLIYEPEFKLLASGSDDCHACIWNIGDVNEDIFQTGSDKPRRLGLDICQPKHVLRGHSDAVHDISWQPGNGRESYEPVLATSSYDGTVRMWNGLTGACLSVFDIGASQLCSHSFRSIGDLIAMTSGSKLVLAKNGQGFFSWADKHNLYEIDWRADGKMVAVGMENHQVLVVNMKALKAPEDEPGSGSGRKPTA